jgi:hypothetical protein
MTLSISETDGRLFRQLHPVALERFCQRVLEERARLWSGPGKSSHQRYLAVFKLMERRDREVAETFDDLRRSTALRQLVLIQSQDLLSAEELGRFSSQTRGAVQILRGA